MQVQKPYSEPRVVISKARRYREHVEKQVTVFDVGMPPWQAYNAKSDKAAAVDGTSKQRGRASLSPGTLNRMGRCEVYDRKVGEAGTQESGAVAGSFARWYPNNYLCSVDRFWKHPVKSGNGN